MLEQNYSERLKQLMQQVPWDIRLPDEWVDFFKDNRRLSIAIAEDERSNQRIAIRTHGILWPEVTLPFLSRSPEPSGIYTRDFSRTGAGFLSSIQFFPEEVVRVAMSAFWVRLKVERARRVGERCFEIGATIIKKFDPSEVAFASPIGNMVKD